MIDLWGGVAAGSVELLNNWYFISLYANSGIQFMPVYLCLIICSECSSFDHCPCNIYYLGVYELISQVYMLPVQLCTISYQIYMACLVVPRLYLE